MQNLNLDEGKIKFGDEWCSAEMLSNRIQEKMKSGDYRFAELAAALERLKIALENSRRLEVSIVISKEEYEELMAVGGLNERECLRKAIMAFIGYDVGTGQNEKKAAVSGKKNVADDQPAPNPQPVQQGEAPNSGKHETETNAVRCFRCKSPMAISNNGAVHEIFCPICDTMPESNPFYDSATRYKDHYLG
ncbi:MAG: hypothetical protein ACOZF0_07000 [Thermodesulfobacteriota bacterium]